jgi:HAD superfamily hydrolase (TIGR01509 family)
MLSRMKQQILLLDLGQTLVRFDWNEAACRFKGKSSSLDPFSVELLAARCKYLEYELGRIGSKEFFFELRRALGFDGTLEEVEEIFCAIFKPWPEREKVLAELQDRFVVAIVSNTCAAHVAYLERALPWLSDIPHRFYSFRIGERKPLPGFYLSVLSQLQCRPWHAVLVDDRPDNCAGALKVGIPALCVSPEDCLRRALSQAGVFLG